MGHRQALRAVKVPGILHVHGSFSSNGFGQLYFYTETLTAKLMKKIYTKTVLPSAQKMFGLKRKCWTLMEDNDKKQEPNLCKKWKADNKVNRMTFPANSGDLQPIENVWGLFKNKLKYKQRSSVKALKRGFKREWNQLPRSYAQVLCDSKNDRLTAVIKTQGDYILY